MWNIPLSMLKNKDYISLMKYFSEQIENSEIFLKIKNELMGQSELIKMDKLKCTDGRIYEYYTQPYKLDNEISGRIWNFRDVTQRALLEEKIKHQAKHDVLTGLPNRLVLFERLNHMINDSGTSSTMVGIFFLDLDRFKLINDSFSHDAGDNVLQLISNRLQSIIRLEDTLVRFGGDDL